MGSSVGDPLEVATQHPDDVVDVDLEQTLRVIPARAVEAVAEDVVQRVVKPGKPAGGVAQPVTAALRNGSVTYICADVVQWVCERTYIHEPVGRVGQTCIELVEMIEAEERRDSVRERHGNGGLVEDHDLARAALECGGADANGGV